jgi:DNA-binding transcriptional MerR regulator
MHIGEVAHGSDVPIKTIRYYEEIGVLPVPARSSSGYREYDADIIDRLQFIRASQSVGFTLSEIREIVDFRDRGDAPCAHVLNLLLHHRDEFKKKIDDLRQAEKVLVALVRRARLLQPEDCSHEGVCHLIPRATQQ